MKEANKLSKEILYTSNYINVSREELIDNLKKELKPKRFDHVLRVEQQALELAEKFDYEDLQQVSIAALMHDHCKDLPKERMYKLANVFSPYEPLKFGNVAIWHGLAAAELAHAKYNISDNDIVNAIAQHTIGAKKMSMLSKIIFVADYIEPGRNFPGIDEARELAGKSLDAAVFFKMRESIKHLVESNEVVYVESVVVYNHWVKKQEE